MGYKNYAGVALIIDDVIENTPHIKDVPGVRSALQGILPRYVSGSFSEKITGDDVRTAIIKVEVKSPHLFIGDEILNQRIEDIEDERERAKWMAVAAMRRRRQPSRQ